MANSNEDVSYDVDDINYEVTGAGETIVLIHGITHSLRGWDPIVPILSERFRVITVDLPGHGKSPIPSDLENVISVYLETLSRFLKKVTPDREKPHVAGNSLGGYFALELALRGEAATATALSPAGFWPNTFTQKLLGVEFRILRFVSRIIAPITPLLARTAVGRAMVYGSFAAKPWKVTPNALIASAAGLRANKIIDHAFGMTFPFSSHTPDSAPLSIYWGRWDLVLPLQWKQVPRILPQAEVHVVGGLGHVPMSDDPKAVASQIEQGASKF